MSDFEANKAVEELTEADGQNQAEEEMEITINNEVELPSNAKQVVFEKIKIDLGEVVDGFEEARGIINGLYKTVFNSSFKPSLNDVTADLLAYVGVKAQEADRACEYKEAFSVEPSMFASRYREKGYVPLCFKISVWADKNKGLNSTVEILNGLLRSLFALFVSKNEAETVEKVAISISGIIEFLSNNGIDAGF